jgi:hypothetical protein
MTYKPEDISKFFARFGIAAPVYEHQFHPDRKWKFDVSWPDRLVALEVEGGLWIHGRHNSPVGMLKDIEKYNAAAMLGWRILKTTPRHLISFGTAAMIKEILK